MTPILYKQYFMKGCSYMNNPKSSQKTIYTSTLYKFLSRKLRRHPFSHSILFYITICLALICWIFVLTQFISSSTITSQDAIPAYKTQSDIFSKNNPQSTKKSLSGSNGSSAISFSISDFFQKTLPNTANSYQQQLFTYLKERDNTIQCISWHEEKNYTDYYFYSPVLAARMKTRPCQNFNLQVAITKNTIYFGTPFIQTSF